MRYQLSRLKCHYTEPKLSQAFFDDGPGKSRLGDVAYQRIRLAILRCDLAPGSEVTEAELALRCGLGKAPIRSALGRLSQDGLIRALPRRGYRIAPVTLGDVHDVFALRLLLEPEAARLAAGRIDGATLRRLDAACRAGYTPGDGASADAFLAANKAFHVAIAEAAGNRRIAELIAQLLDEMQRILHIGLDLRNRTEEMQHEHRALVEALAAADGAGAAVIAHDQIVAAREMVLAALIASPALKGAAIHGQAPER